MNFAPIRRLVRYRIAVTLFFYVLLTTRLYLKYAINSPDEYGILSGFVLLLLFCCWAIILLDMIFNKIKNKIFWIVIMFLLAYFTPLFYLFQRKTVEKYKFDGYYNDLKKKISGWKK